ncbi:MAG: ATP-binding protein [Thiohalomonadales bacterium]
MILSIKKRFLAVFLTLLTLMVTITVSKIYIDAKQQIRELFDAELAQEAHLILDITLAEYSELLSGREISEAIGVENTLLKNLHKYHNQIVFQVWNKKGQLIIRSADIPNTPMIDIDQVFVNKTIGDKRWRIYSVYDQDSNVRVQVAQHFQRRSTLIGVISKQLFWSIIILLPLFIPIIYLSVNRALAPFMQITRHIQQRAIHSLEPINVTQVPDEIRSIITALNSLFGRLRIAIDDIVVFTSNAAHELRTPLTSQKLHAQIALETKDPQIRQDALREVMSGVNHSTQIVEQLLMLARLDPEDDVQEHEVAELNEITQDRIAELVPLAFEKNIEMSLDADEKFAVLGKPPLLAVLVRNLVENAIRYTPENGKIDISIRHEPLKIILQVADSGPGIPINERQNVFKRFYRGEKTGDTVGTGLGLSMVERIAQIHKATISLADSSYNGLQIEIAFLPARY